MSYSSVWLVVLSRLLRVGCGAAPSFGLVLLFPYLRLRCGAFYPLGVVVLSPLPLHFLGGGAFTLHPFGLVVRYSLPFYVPVIFLFFFSCFRGVIFFFFHFPFCLLFFLLCSCTCLFLLLLFSYLACCACSLFFCTFLSFSHILILTLFVVAPPPTSGLVLLSPPSFLGGGASPPLTFEWWCSILWAGTAFFFSPFEATVDTCYASVSGCCCDTWRNTWLDSGNMLCFSTPGFWTNFPVFSVDVDSDPEVFLSVLTQIGEVHASGCGPCTR